MRRFLTVPTAILTAVFLVAACTGSDDTAEEPTTAAPAPTVAPPETATTVTVTATTSSSAVVSPETAIATVQALLDAYNAYDPDAALPLLRGDANDNGAYPGDPVWYRFNFDMPELVGTQAVLSECAADDNGNVTCIRTWTDTLLSGKAGIVYSAAEEYHISAEGLITLRIGSDRPAGVEDNEAFEAAFGEWMVIAHPEAYERFYVPAFNSKNAENWNSPEGVAELSQLIDEFVAQSDEYPLGDAAATATPVAAELRLTFHGEGCTYEGPTELQPGPVILRYVNESDELSQVFFSRLDEGYTAQDVIDQLGPQPARQEAPSWVTAMNPLEAASPGMTLSWRFDLEPGVYTMVCARIRPLEGWFGAGLTVEE